jgi:hypothetical protein
MKVEVPPTVAAVFFRLAFCLMPAITKIKTISTNNQEVLVKRCKMNGT